jgi:hypothetical protein
MTIDERLEFLRQSTESLHATCQELHAAIAEEAGLRKLVDANERAARKALLVGIAAYIQALNGESNGEA